MSINKIYIALLVGLFFSCSKPKEFPCLGIPQNGQECYKVADFVGKNQKAEEFTSKDVLGKP